MTRKQYRQLKREARARAYQSGGLGAKALDFDGPVGDRARAAADKQARKAAKRLRDAEHSALGEMASRESIESGRIVGFMPQPLPVRP